MRATARALSGVSAAGLRTVVQPAASAGPSLRVTIAAGKFHGVMSTAGPTGCLIASTSKVPFGAVAIRPSARTASSEYQSRKSAA